ncbi:MAG: hypothetical protein WA886_17740, partial [Candidatus Acidiferrales bacterium]
MRMPGLRTAGILLAGFAGAGLILSAPLAARTDAKPIAKLAASGGLSSAAADASAQIQNAQRQFNAGNYSGAIATLQAAVQQNPNSGEADYWLG